MSAISVLSDFGSASVDFCPIDDSNPRWNLSSPVSVREYGQDLKPLTQVHCCKVHHPIGNNHLLINDMHGSRCSIKLKTCCCDLIK